MAHASDAIELVVETPDAATYLRLRQSGGLSAFTQEAARAGLSRSVFCVLLKTKGEAIGMGRIIGDGGCFFQIVDIVVQPSYQGQGLGKRIMSALVEYLQAHAPKSAYVSLIADVPANKLYEQFGFKETAPQSLGMAFSIT